MYVCLSVVTPTVAIFGQGRQVPKRYSSCSSSCSWNQLSKKIPNTFLIRSRAQRNFAYTFLLILPPYRSTVSDFLKLMYN